jgi:hypothetical protein
MELQEALDKASQILDEERESPTVSYDYTPLANEDAEFSAGKVAMQTLAAIAGTANLSNMRKQRPREIQNPTGYRFKSTNYNLLCALLSRLKESDRQGFVSVIALRLASAPGCAIKKHAVSYPGWNNCSSELPLVAEFLVRHNGKAHLSRALWEAERIRGHACLLRQLEETIAFNYTVFAESDYETLARAMLNISAQATAKEKEYRKHNNINALTTGFCMEIEASSKAIAEQCRKARYLYVKELLAEGLNVEINQDKIAVEQYIQRYGFPHALVESLNEAARLYRDGTTPFDFKGSMANLRSFLESVQAGVMPALHAKFGGQLPQKWGDGLAYLSRNNVLSKTEEQFVSSLYTLISDEGVHPLIAEKEDARLTYNSVIEYVLRFFRKVEKLGIKIALAARP